MTIQPIAYDLLREKGASPDEAKALSRVFAGSAQTMINRAIKHALDINWDWAARHLLPDSARDAYRKATAPFRDTYNKALSSARDDCDEALSSAQEVYKKALSSAWGVYNKALSSAHDDYAKAIAPAQEVYNKAGAEAFARAYLSQEDNQ